MEQTQLLFGQRKAKANLQKLVTEDEFAETPIFGHNVDEAKKQAEGNPFLKDWPVNGVLAGTFKGQRTMKLKEGEKEARTYMRMVTVDGQKFRIYSPGQLRFLAESQIKMNQYVEITYRGKTEEPVKLKDGSSRQVHQYEIMHEEALQN